MCPGLMGVGVGTPHPKSFWAGTCTAPHLGTSANVLRLMLSTRLGKSQLAGKQLSPVVAFLLSTHPLAMAQGRKHQEVGGPAGKVLQDCGRSRA